MRFTRYLEDILRAKSDIKLLRALCKYPTKEFTESELARVTGVGQKTVNRRMPKYVSYGIIGVRTVGKANVYHLNREHYIVGQLSALFQTEEKSKLELKRILQNAFKGDRTVISLVLFGSVARGREEPASDIDVLVLTEDKNKAGEKLRKVREVVMKKFGSVVSEYVLTPEELKRKRGKHALREITTYGELISGKPLKVRARDRD